ncbi:MAG: hypothetical protein H6605_06345 [Flavobacteriales bacterium]|nr:hypothetical protein [Flavobacteriales bacterium]
MKSYKFLLLVCIGSLLGSCTLKEDGIYSRGKVKFTLQSTTEERELYIDGEFEGTFTKDKTIKCKFEPSETEHIAKTKKTGFLGGWRKEQKFTVNYGSDRVQEFNMDD